MSFSFSRFLRQCRQAFAPRGQVKARSRLAGARKRPILEELENRIAPAFNLTLSFNATNLAVTSSTMGTTTTFNATATGANLSWNDVGTALGLGNNVVVNSGSAGTEAGNITDQTGVQISSISNNQSLTFQSGTGTNLVGDISIEDINLAGTNDTIVISANRNVTTGILSNGTFAARTPLASASITASTGSVSEAGPFQGAIDAVNVAIQASTGIGSSGTPLLTQASNLVAQTATGGIFISNTGALTIGFTGEPFAGVKDTGASGDISLTNSGSVSITRSGDILKGPGNITVQANGASNILTGGNNSGISGSAAVQAGGTAALLAGQDILLGNTAGATFGDVDGGGSALLTAGRNITVDEGSFVDAHGMGTVMATAGTAGNITLTAAASLGASSRITSEGGAISLTTGAGGTFTNNSTTGTRTGVRSTQNGGNGPITISADDMVITGPIDAGTSTTTSIVTLQQATTTTRNVDLGLGTTANDLDLSDAELGLVTAGDVLRIGRSDNTGSITVTAPVTTHAGYSTLHLLTGDGVGQSGTGALSVSQLAVDAANNVDLLTNANAVGTLAGSVVNTSQFFNFSAAGALAVGAVDGVTGITAMGSDVTLSAATTLTLNQPINLVVGMAGGTVRLVASGGISQAAAGTIQAVQVGARIQTIGANTAAGDIVLDKANAVGFFSANNAAAAGKIAFNTTSSLGVTNVGGGTGYIATTGVVSTNGDVTLTAATDLSLGSNVNAGTATAKLIATAGSISQNGSVVGAAVTAANIALIALTGIGSSGTPLTTQGSKLAAADTGATAVGDIQISNTGALTIGVVAGVTGVQRTGGSTGSINITAASPLTVNAPVTDTTGGDITLTAGSANSNAAADVLTINADVTASGGNGSITLNGNTLVVNAATVSVVGTGNVTGNFGGTGGAATFNNGSIVNAVNGLIGVTAAASTTLNGTASLVTTGGGNIQLTTDDVTIAATATIDANMTNVVTIRNFTAGRQINLGTNTNLGLTDAELDRIGAGTLIIGRNDANASGTITLSSLIDLTTGSHTIATLHLLTGAAVVDGTATEQTDLKVTNLAIEAVTGIGSANDLNVAVSNLAFRNTTSNNVRLSNTLALTITAVDTLDGTVGHQVGNFAVAGVTTLSAAGPMTFAITTTSAGTLTATTTETGTETTTPLPPPDDNITVNSGVTVESTGGDVDFTSADSIVIQTGATVKSDSGAVNITIGNGDNDNDATLTLNGTVSASPLNFTAPGDIFLDTLPTALTNRPGQTVTITSATGGIFDNTTPDGVADDTDVTAANLALSALTGIGRSTDPLELKVSNVVIQTSTGGIFISNTGALTIGFTGAPFQGAKVTGSPGTPVPIIISAASPLTVNAPVTDTTGGDITLTAGSANSNAAADVLTINAAVTASGGDGSITLNGNTLVVNATNVSVVGAGNVTGNLGGTGGATTFNNGSTVSAVNGLIDMTGTAGTTLNGTATIQTTGTGNIRFTTDDVAIAATATISANDASATPDADNRVTIQNFTAGQAIDLGTNTAGKLGLTNGELGRITAETLQIGRSDATASGNITVSAAVTLPNVPTLDLETGGSISDNVAADTITVTNLALRAASGISLDTVKPAAATVFSLAFVNGGGATGSAVRVSNSGAAQLAAVDGLASSSNLTTGSAAQVAAATTTLSALSPFTYTVNLTSAGTITQTTADNNGTHIDNITVNGGVTVESTGGDVVFHAGDDIVIAATSTVKADVGNIDFVSGFADTDGEGVMTLDGTVTAPAGLITLDVNVDNAAETDGVTEAATTTISALSLLLLGPAAGTGKQFSLGVAGATNKVNTIAANTSAPIVYLNGQTLTVGTIGITIGITSNNNDVTLCAQPGNLILANSINAGTGTVRLDAQAVAVPPPSGDVTETGTAIVTANTLGVRADGNIDMENGNMAVNVGLQAGGTIKYNSAIGFNTLTVAAANCFRGATPFSGGGDICLTSAGNIVITSAINDPGFTVRINAGGSVSQNAGAAITAANLGVRAIGNVDLCVSGSPNDITGQFAADTSAGPAGSHVFFLDSSGFTVDTITADGVCFTTPVVGVVTNNGTVDLVSTAGAIAVNQVIDTTPTGGGTSTATVRLQAGTGGTPLSTPGNAIAQTAAGIITAANLSAVAFATLASINIDLTTAVNQVNGDFSAFDNGPGAFVRFLNSGSFTVAGIPSDACALAASQVTTNNGNVSLNSQTGSISLASPINTSGTTATVQLQAATSVSQTAAGIITAGSLGVVAATGIGLDTAVNVVANFTADDSTSGNVKFQDNIATLTVGNTVAATPPTFPNPVTGVTGLADVTICNTGNMAVNQAVTAGAANTVRLTSTTGSVAQLATGIITAASLGVVAATGIGLDTAINVVGNFTANDTTSGNIKFRDNVANLTVGNNVAADAPCFPAAVTGVTGPADITICNTGNLAINQAITAGAANTVRLTSTTGNVTQLAAGIITGASLGVVAATGIVLDTAVNVVGNFTANDTTSGNIKFRDNVANLTVGNTEAADAPCFAAAVTGVTGPADITICNAGNLAINQAITAGAANTVRLTSTTGNVTQLATGIITGASLGVVAATGIVLDTAVNVVGNFTASDITSSNIKFRDNVANLTVGNTVAADAPCFPAAVTGVAGPADITICNTGNLAINQAVTAGAANTVRLTSTTGNVTQLATGIITAASLGVVAATGIGLDTAVNVAGNFTASDITSGNIKFRDNVANLTVGNTVAADAPCFPAAVTGVTGPADITICNTGNLAINQAVTAGAANTVRLTATTGNVTQLATGIITAASLGVVAAKGIALDTAVNVAGNFTASDTTSGAIKFRDNVANLTVGNTVAADAPCFAAAVTGVTGPADITICNTGNLAINQAVTAGAANTVRLTSTTGNVTQLATGIITAASLGVVAATGIGLDTAVNVAGNFTASDTTSGAIKFRDNVANLTLGNTVTADAPCFPAAVTGVTGPADITICNTGNLAVNQAVTAGAANTVRLTSTTGNVTQLATGIITAASLGVVAATGIALDTAVNVVGNFTASDSTSGNIKFRDNVANLTVGNTVAADAPCFAGAVTGVTGPADITICNTGNLAVNQTVTAGAANTVRLTSTSGNVTQLATGVITANSLGVSAATGILLATAVNVVNNFTAFDATSGNIFFQDNVANLTLGNTVGADAPCFPTARMGVMGPGDIIVCNTGNLTANQAVTAGAAGTVGLTSINGTVTQLATGIITSANLGVTAAGDILLDVAANVVSGTFAANTTGAGRQIRFHDTLGYAVGAVPAESCFPGATGVTTNNGNILLVNDTGNLAITANITAGPGNNGTAITCMSATPSGPTIRISSAGMVTENAAPVAITGTALGVRAGGAVSLNSTANDVAVFAAAGTGAGGAISYTDASGLIIGQVIADGLFATTTTGVTTTNNNNLTITTGANSQVGGGLLVNEPLNVGTGAINLTVDTGNAGDVTFEPTGTITATQTTVTTGAGVDVFTIINPAGSLFTNSGTLIYHAGGQVGDALRVLSGGSNALNETFTVGGSDPSAGEIDYTGGPSAMILFDEVNSKVIDTVAVNQLTAKATNSGNNSILLNNGDFNSSWVAAVACVPSTPVGHLGLEIDNFQPLNFRNKGILTVNGSGAGNSLGINFTDNGSGLTQATLKSGGGNSIFSITATAAQTLLNGTGGNNYFTFADGADLSGGGINGGGGPGSNNYLVLKAYTADVEVNLGNGLNGTALSRPEGPGKNDPNVPFTHLIANLANIQNVIGGSGNDVLIGSTGNGNGPGNVLDGQGGNNNITAESGNNVLLAGSGTNTLRSSPTGNDTLFAGNDAQNLGTLITPPSKEFLFGGLGFDVFLIPTCQDVLLRNINFFPGNGQTSIDLLTTPRNATDVAQAHQALQQIITDANAPVPNPAATPANTDPPAATAAGLARVVQGFLDSAENESRFITSYYQQYLGRTPGAGEVQGWMNFLNRGGQPEDMLVGFLSSPEFYAHEGGTDAAFVQGLYSDILGRTASPAEVAGWVATLHAASAASVVRGFVTSDEYRSNLINGWYQQYLGRSADQGGLSYWLGQLHRGATQDQIQEGLVTSIEYQQRAQQLYSGDPNAADIIGLYFAILGRSPSNGDVLYWDGQLLG